MEVYDFLRRPLKILYATGGTATPRRPSKGANDRWDDVLREIHSKLPLTEYGSKLGQLCDALFRVSRMESIGDPNEVHVIELRPCLSNSGCSQILKLLASARDVLPTDDLQRFRLSLTVDESDDPDDYDVPSALLGTNYILKSRRHGLLRLGAGVPEAIWKLHNEAKLEIVYCVHPVGSGQAASSQAPAAGSIPTSARASSSSPTDVLRVSPSLPPARQPTASKRARSSSKKSSAAAAAPPKRARKGGDKPLAGAASPSTVDDTKNAQLLAAHREIEELRVQLAESRAELTAYKADMSARWEDWNSKYRQLLQSTKASLDRARREAAKAKGGTAEVDGEVERLEKEMEELVE